MDHCQIRMCHRTLAWTSDDTGMPVVWYTVLGGRRDFDVPAKQFLITKKADFL